jgi:repressor LexA
MIPVFNSVAAGFGAYASSDIVEYIPLYIENDFDVEDTICITVRGQSMYPKIEDGDKIVVRRQESVDNGRVAVVMIGEEAVVKRVNFDGERLELTSFNPEYPPRIIEGEELANCRIVGLVQQVIKAV